MTWREKVCSSTSNRSKRHVKTIPVKLLKQERMHGLCHDYRFSSSSSLHPFIHAVALESYSLTTPTLVSLDNCKSTNSFMSRFILSFSPSSLTSRTRRRRREVIILRRSWNCFRKGLKSTWRVVWFDGGVRDVGPSSTDLLVIKSDGCCQGWSQVSLVSQVTFKRLRPQNPRKKARKWRAHSPLKLKLLKVICENSSKWL